MKNLKVFEFLKKEIKKYENDIRVKHSLGVYDEAMKLANYVGLSEEDKFKLGKAAILHDITKDFSGEKQIELCTSYGLVPPKKTKDPMPTIHQDTGGYFAREKFGCDIVDDDVFSAISCHTTGKVGMNILDKILFLADYIEPSRQYNSCIELRNRVYNELDKININDKEAILYVITKGVIDDIQNTITFLTEKRRYIDHRMILAWNDLLRKGD